MYKNMVCHRVLPAPFIYMQSCILIFRRLHLYYYISNYDLRIMYLN